MAKPVGMATFTRRYCLVDEGQRLASGNAKTPYFLIFADSIQKLKVAKIF